MKIKEEFPLFSISLVSSLTGVPIRMITDYELSSNHNEFPFVAIGSG
jgi:hypothetical protein